MMATLINQNRQFPTACLFRVIIINRSRRKDLGRMPFFMKRSFQAIKTQSGKFVHRQDMHLNRYLQDFQKELET